MRIYNGKEITFNELLEENLDWLLQEYPQYNPDQIADELDKMMRDTHPLVFDSDEEEEKYDDMVDSLDLEKIVERISN